MSSVSTWERLAEALKRIQSEAGDGKEEVQTAICQAIADGGVNIQCKLGTRISSGTRISANPLPGNAFLIPSTIKPEDLDWEASRPKKPWLVPRGQVVPPGHWSLEWIELRQADVTNVLCVTEQGKPAQSGPSKARATRGRPRRDSVRQVLAEVYPDGVPDQVVLPNQILCRAIQAKLKEKGLTTVSDDSSVPAQAERSYR